MSVYSHDEEEDVNFTDEKVEAWKGQGSGPPALSAPGDR